MSFPLLRLLPLGDISSHLRRTHDTTGGILDRRDRHGDIELPSGVRDANGFEMFESLATPDTRQYLLFLISPIWWNQPHDRRPDHFLGFISENAFRPVIPAGDDTVQVLSDDSIVGRGHDGCQLASSHFSKMALRHLSVPPDTPGGFPFNCQNIGMPLQFPSIFQFQQIEALLI